MGNVSGLRRNIKNIAHNYTDAQVKVREATSNDPWGPPSSLMSEISDLTYNVVAFSEIMQMIWKRLNDHGKNYRHVYKALVLLDYLVKTGNEKVAQQCKENIFAIHTLRDFQYYEEGKDQGINVREKSKQLEGLLKDDERLKNERVKALKARERFAQQTTGFGTGSDSNNFLGSPSESFGSDSGIRARPAAPPTDLDLARPQTAGEEELQLQLALAMSREEAEKEDEKRRSDDVRLALAINQSQDCDTVGDGQAAQPSHLLDLLDVDVDVAGAEAGWVDPWGTPAHPADPPAPVMPPRPKVKSPGDFLTPVGAQASSTDAWGMAVATPTATSLANTPSQVDAWGTPASPVGNAPSSSNLTQLVADPWAPASSKPADPWSPQPPVRTAASANDPWLPASGLGASPSVDGFDLLTNRVQQQPQLAGSPVGSSSDNGASSPFDLSEIEGALAVGGAKPKKSAEAFLGPNSGLVNLENLVKFTNVPLKPGITPLANPFQQQPAPRPSINELRNQQNFAGLQQPLPSMGAWGGPAPAMSPGMQMGSGMPLMGGSVMLPSGSGVSSPTFNPFLA